MSKTKSSAIPHYELLYIIPNKYSENEVKPIIEKVNKIIIDRGGKITFNQEWGKKRLTYPIKSFNFGYYSLVEFDLVGSLLAQIDKDLRMMNEILRHQVVVKKVKTEKEIAKDKKIAEKIIARGLREKKAMEIEDHAKIKSRSKDKIKIEVDLEKLDEKLDKILETNDLL
ncbi:MAG: 30S ribosomal protein S6 [Patescibacteria group bacterium]